MTKKSKIIILNIFLLLYSFRLGFIWTGYGHGGQIAGLPFFVVGLILTIIYFKTKNEDRKKLFYRIALTWYLTIFAFSLTIELVRHFNENYFALLYMEPNGMVDYFLLTFIIIGIITIYLINRQAKKLVGQNKHST